MQVYVVIMAGGKGERLWPLSHEARPKQLLCFGSDRSLLRATFERTVALASPEHVFVVTNEQIAENVRMQLPEVPAGNILAEPAGRNTAPCIAYAAASISMKDKDAVMAIFPSDQLINDEDLFIRAVGFGISTLNEHPELLITLGMIPDQPETGYGYIAPGGIIVQDKVFALHRVNRFHEKPQRNKAVEYLNQGCLWNAGMFLWRVDAILDEFRSLMPGMYHDLVALRTSLSAGKSAINTFYDKVKPVSIDYGIMEKTRNAATIPVDFGWNDIGSWDAIGNVLAADNSGNVTDGDVIMEDSSGSVIFSTHKKIVAIGVEDLVVVEGDKEILVCPRSRSQELSAVMKRIK
ncbi:MAG TPA: mannose-1-phosphate guanylyltransferase [Deltaproteobacteria bacterium]|nr:mannose-1-phosphate guanylyltransferase [Deltaproteobacteria bacterium]